MKNNIRIASWFLTIVAALLLSSTCHAAIDRGAVQGTVTDAQNASVPKVRVEVTNTATGVTITQFTNDSGSTPLRIGARLLHGALPKLRDSRVWN